MVVSVSSLLGLLGWFKYYGFFTVNIDTLSHGLGGGDVLPLLQVTLPVGISFFTFMAMSYVVDVYRGRIEPASGSTSPSTSPSSLIWSPGPLSAVRSSCPRSGPSATAGRSTSPAPPG